VVSGAGKQGSHYGFFASSPFFAGAARGLFAFFISSAFGLPTAIRSEGIGRVTCPVAAHPVPRGPVISEQPLASTDAVWCNQRAGQDG
jgi:hypothetical protein